MDDPDDNPFPLDEADRAEIEAVCADYGFPLDGIETGDDMLRLAPTSLDGLPNADDLQKLADALESRGFRFVTFVVPDGD
ncbi:MAG: hypothetical protein ABEN55_15395 [Bradymonadaceae bacterium]